MTEYFSRAITFVMAMSLIPAFSTLGQIDTPASEADVIQTGALGGGQFGRSVAFLGDVNGDGFGDYAIGSRGDASGTGRVDVFDGASNLILWSQFGEAASNQFGEDIAAAGDVIDP